MMREESLPISGIVASEADSSQPFLVGYEVSLKHFHQKWSNWWELSDSGQKNLIKSIFHIQKGNINQITNHKTIKHDEIKQHSTLKSYYPDKDFGDTLKIYLSRKSRAYFAKDQNATTKKMYLVVIDPKHEIDS